MIEITEIPNELKDFGFKFVKIRKGEKGPFEKDWATENNYGFDDEELKKHLAEGGNYGVVCGYGFLAVIDCDKQELADRIVDKLPETLVVRTGGGGFHFYYIIPDLDEPIRLSDDKLGDVGDVQWHGKQVVGPNSLHPSGNNYRIENNSEIAEISYEDLKETIGKWVVGTKKSKKWTEDVFEESYGDIPIEQVIDLDKLHQRDDEYYGEHPVHGSSTGKNFWVNVDKNCWHCFRHDVGGGPLAWLAIREGIVKCEDVDSDKLKENFNDILSLAEGEGLIELDDKDDEKTWRYGPLKVRVKWVSDGWKVNIEDEDGEKAGRPLTIPEDKGLTEYYQEKLDKHLEEPFKHGFIRKPDGFDREKAFVQLVIKMEDNLPKSTVEMEETNGEEKPEIDDKADEWLNSEDLISKIDRVIHHHLVGETKNAFIVFLTLLSTKTRHPANLRPQGESSLGKSWLVTRVARLLPAEMKVIREGFSKMAPWNKAEPIEGDPNRRRWNLWGKIIIVLEEENSEEFLKQFRSVLSHDEEVVTYEVTNTESKSRETLKVDMVGWPAYIGLQVGQKMDEQEETRAMTLTPDSGPEKYSKANWFDAYKRETPWLEGIRERETEIVQKIVRKLKSYKILLPPREKIKNDFPSFHRRHMRDWKYFQSLVEAMAILHQKQRPILEINGEDFLVASPEDVEAVVKLAKGAMIETLHGLDSKVRKFWEAMNSVEYVEGYRGLGKIYKRCFGREDVSRTTMRRKYIEKLEDKGLIDIEQGSGRNPNTFRAVGKLSSLSDNFEKIIDTAFDSDLEGTTFSRLLSTDGGVHVGVKKCPVLEKNPIKNPNEGIYEKVWGYLCDGVDIVDNNRNVLEKSYEEDYIGKPSDNEMSDKTDKEPEKEKSESSDDIDIKSLDKSGGKSGGEEGGDIDIKPVGQDELVREVLEKFEELYEGETPHIDDATTVVSDHVDAEKSRVRQILKKESEKGKIQLERDGFG